MMMSAVIVLLFQSYRLRAFQGDGCQEAYRSGPAYLHQQGPQAAAALSSVYYDDYVEVLIFRC